MPSIVQLQAFRMARSLNATESRQVGLFPKTQVYSLKVAMAMSEPCL